MPQEGITMYNILLSCPSDVQDEKVIVRDVVNEFNHTIGCANNIILNIIDWVADVYPQTGAKPQDIINKQIVDRCDAIVAIFWTRFGNPTDKYKSGTEEEIERFIADNKQTFIYFSDKAVCLSTVNTEQYGRVIKFKQKLSKRGLYSSYSSHDAFRKSLTNHLYLFMLNILKNSAGKSIRDDFWNIKKSPINFEYDDTNLFRDVVKKLTPLDIRIMECINEFESCSGILPIKMRLFGAPSTLVTCSFQFRLKNNLDDIGDADGSALPVEGTRLLCFPLVDEIFMLPLKNVTFSVSSLERLGLIELCFSQYDPIKNLKTHQEIMSIKEVSHFFREEGYHESNCSFHVGQISFTLFGRRFMDYVLEEKTSK